MTRSRDVADTQDNLGGAVAPFVAGKNAVINGGFDIWQRGTSISVTSNPQYVADRFSLSRSATSTMTVSRQATGDSTNLPNIQYCGRFQRNSGDTSTAAPNFAQSIETINSLPYVGKTVTLSFYARVGANWSAGSSFNAYFNSGTGTDQNTLSGYTGQVSIATINPTLTTSWVRYTMTGTVSSTATEIAFGFYWTPTGTAGANDYVDVTGVQVEIGSVATPFARAGGSIGGELALCQRYYYKDTKTVLRADQVIAGSIVYGVYYLPQEMRTTPTLTQTGGATETSNTSATTLSNDGSSSNARKTGIYVTGGASTGTVYMYRTVEWSAEL